MRRCILIHSFRSKRLFPVLLSLACLFACYYNAYAQAPVITYTTPNVYNVSKTITPLTPSNSGGPVAIYGQTTTLATGFNLPLVTALDAAGNVYVADSQSQVIKKVTPAGVVTVYAGSGIMGATNGIGTAASFNHPAGLAFDAAGNLYVADEDNNLIRKIAPDLTVTTFAGNGSVGATNGAANAASFNNPCGMVMDAAGNLYVTDYYNNMVRKITSAGVVSTYAGSGASGSTDGAAASASFRNPISVTIDPTGNLYVADRLSQKIRKITPGGIVSTFAGNGNQGSVDGPATTASFNYPTSITIDKRGYLFVADKGVSSNGNIRRVAPDGTVSTTAGNSLSGYADGIRQAASFSGPFGIISDGSVYLYVADYGNNAIRKVVSATYAISPAILPAGLTFDEITGIISGTPTVVWPTTIYIITAYNSSGSGSFPVSITVIDPAAALQPTITASTVTGSATSCQNSPSTNYQQFTISGSDLTASVNVTAPAGFEVSTSAASNYSSSLTLNPVAGTIASTVIYVRLSATAPAGNNTGNVVLSSTGASSVNVAVAGTVTATPMVNSIQNVSACNSATVSAINLSGTGASYSWTNNTPSIGLAANGSGNIPSFTAVNNTGNVVAATITVIPMSSGGCAGTPVSFTITVNPAITPSVQIAATKTTVCEGDMVTFTATATPNNSTYVPTYQWQVNGINAGTNNPNFAGTFNDNDMVTCTVSYTAACANSVTSTPVTITVGKLPTVSFAGDIKIAPGEKVTLQPIFSSNVAGFAWSPALGLSDNMIATPIASPGVTTTYTLLVTTASGCTASATINVLVSGNIAIPNGFTPNGDGINDTWNIPALAFYPSCSVKIYNRYGSLLYNSLGYPAAWNGTYQGKALPSGIYYYVIIPGDGSKAFKGSLAIIR